MPSSAFQRPELADLAERLAELLSDVAADEPLTFHPVPYGEPPARVAAVDGSSTTLLDAKSFRVVAYRSAVALAPAGGRPSMRPGPTRLRLLQPDDAAPAVAEALEALGQPSRLPERLSVEAALDALRGLEEHRMALSVLAELDAGDVLLLDGAVGFRPATLPQALVEHMLDEAHARGVLLAGVCKTTSMTLGGVPALAHVRRRAYRECPHPTWGVPLPRHTRTLLAHPWAVRLNPAQRTVFRVDVSPHVEDPVALLAAVAAVARHPGYPGYPYPLALAHNAATLDEREKEDLLHEVRRSARGAGVDEDAWDAAFHDYHEDLERGL